MPLSHEVFSNIDLRSLPAKSGVGYLDAEIAGEGQRVVLSDGDQVAWTPPPVKPAIPDMSQIKAIRHYFGRVGYQVYPAWLYHPTEEPRLVKNAQEAAGLGVCYREATVDEKSRYGIKHVWDWEEGAQWRPNAWKEPKFDPNRPGTGKIYTATAPNPVHAQNAMIEALIPKVAEAVTKVLRSDGPSAPAHVDPAQWDAFLQFQAWQKTQGAVNAMAQEIEPAVVEANPDAALSPEQERLLWEEEARRKGVKTDGRWSLERLKAEIEKAA
jgi:hypothetical protein